MKSSVKTSSPRVVLFHGDALDLEKHVEKNSAQLAYLDPPFNVGVAFKARRLVDNHEARAPEGRSEGAVAYDDRWPSLEFYLAWLEKRIAMVRGLLSSEGTMWLHLDHRAVHEAKVSCDRIFGSGSFIGEVIWLPGNGSKARRGPGATHQTMLLYAKSGDFIWNGKDPALRASFAKTSLSMHFKNKDDGGRAFRDRTINGKTYRYYADEGRALGSVWSDCPSMTANTPLRKESTGYPTQKPLKLLDRIVRASSNEGGLVIDPFCGSGTTLEAAANIGRRAIGSDIGATSIKTISKRLNEAKIRFETRPIS